MNWTGTAGLERNKEINYSCLHHCGAVRREVEGEPCPMERENFILGQGRMRTWAAAGGAKARPDSGLGSSPAGPVKRLRTLGPFPAS